MLTTNAFVNFRKLIQHRGNNKMDGCCLAEMVTGFQGSAYDTSQRRPEGSAEGRRSPARLSATRTPPPQHGRRRRRGSRHGRGRRGPPRRRAPRQRRGTRRAAYSRTPAPAAPRIQTRAWAPRSSQTARATAASGDSPGCIFSDTGCGKLMANRGIGRWFWLGSTRRNI